MKLLKKDYMEILDYYGLNYSKKLPGLGFMGFMGLMGIHQSFLFIIWIYKVT